MIGTPFEIKNDEIHNKRVAKIDRKENEEYALNEKGQRRFHGAFTGGFHAGYNNTVGSEAGFTPAQYDRNKRYTIFDIMDEEDLGEHAQGKTIQMHEGYQGPTSGHIQAVKNNLGQSVFGGIMPDELIIAPKSTIGYKLLKKLGWNERSRKSENFKMEVEEDSDSSIDFGKIENLEVSDLIADNIVSAHVQNEPSQQEDISQVKRMEKLKRKLAKTASKPKPPRIDNSNYYKGPLKYKEDKYGLGYIPTSTDFALEKQRTESDNNRISMGKLNYDGLVYQEDDKEMMEVMEEADQGAYERAKDQKMQEAFQDRREEKNDFYSSGWLVKPIVQETEIMIPTDYDWAWRKVQEGMSNEAVQIRRRKLDANLRAMILGEGEHEEFEEPEESNIGLEQANKALDNQFDEGTGLLDNKQMKEEENLQGTKHLLVDIPFKNGMFCSNSFDYFVDKDKIQRFKNYINELENHVIIMDSSSNMMKGSQIRKEKEEFQRLYQLELALRKEKEFSGKYSSGVVMSKNYKEELSKEKQLELISQLEKERKSRTVVVDWQPNALL
jgi:hypothetical protein